MATGNINMIINGDKRKQQATIKVKESKEFVNVVNNLTDLVFNRSEEMSSGLYLELQNTFMELYNLELMSDILLQSNKTVRNQNKTNMSMEQKRQALRNGATHMIMCNNCSRVVCKSFLTEHLSSSVCKDNKKIIEAAGKDTLNNNFNEEVLCKYITPTQSS
tara:strand:+ start:7254 stop:7739 length:486 start_codon:yes stop_codon:yes gene_type:complete